ncbi:MAG: Dyp-type peroxidase [Bacteroidota bacterium]
MIDLTQKAIDQRDLQFHNLFSNLQGNILKGHGREHTTHIFVRFNGGRKLRARAWVRDFAERITSCQTQLKDTEVFKRNCVSGGMFVGFLLAAEGYDYFGHNTETNFPDAHAFRGGMAEGSRTQKNSLNDPPQSQWELGFRDGIHAMILLADADLNKMGNEARKIIKEIDGFGRILTVEYGNAIKNANGDGLEHFGYVDGISQPLFFKDEVDKYNKMNDNTNPLKFDPSASLDLVLVNDPLSPDADSFGSYFVFRKLEQNVRGFKTAEKRLADALRLQGEDDERAGAMIVGRFEDGTPLTDSNMAGLIGSGIMNNFNYDSDQDGARCPFHAHIRKSNPRSSEGDKKRIMARRGITYGHRNVSTDIELDFAQMPTKNAGVGLLFMSFQQSIENQFAFIQRSWVNNPNFIQGGVGIDPIIGQDGIRNVSTGAFPTIYNDPNSMEVESFNSFVEMKGGEYFFAPSIPFLKNI